MRSRLDRRRRAILGTAARAEQAGFAEQIDIGQRRLARGPGRAGGDLFRCAPESDDVAQARQPRRQAHFVQPQRQRRRRNQRVAGLVIDLLLPAPARRRDGAAPACRPSAATSRAKRRGPRMTSAQMLTKWLRLAPRRFRATIASPPRSDARCARGTGRKPSSVTSKEISAALRPSWITAREVGDCLKIA